MKRNVKAGKPFYAYVPFTLVHYPTLAHPDFAGKTGYGEFADSLAEMDHHVGQILDAVQRTGHREEHDRRLHQRQRSGGDAALARLGGPVVRLVLHGHGRLAACAVHRPLAGPGARRPHQQRDRPRGRYLHRRWPASPARDVPKDRIIDGVDQTDFLLGKQEKSNREGFPCYVGDTLHAVKWRQLEGALRLAGVHVRPAAAAAQSDGCTT